MAFKMNRPIIKGTANHKASVAKATSESIVSQRRTQADAGLVGAADALGRSYKPQAIDYSIKQKGIDFLDIKKDKEDKPSKPKKMKKLNEPKLKGPDLEKREVPELKQKDRKDEAVSIERRGFKLPKMEEKIFGRLKYYEDKNRMKVENTKDRFEEAAKKFGYDLSTEKGYNEAEKAMEYNDRTDEWQNPQVAVDNLESKKQGPSEEEKRIEAEVAAKQAETIRLEKERQAEKKAIADEKKRIAQEALAEKKAKKKAEIEAKNAGIRERNKIKKEAREYYGDSKLTQKRLDAYKKMMSEQEEALSFQPEFKEQDDPDDFNEKAVSKPSEQELDKITYKPQVINDEVAEPVVEQKKRTGRQRRLDKKWESAGPSVRANMKADGYVPLESKSPMEMRDNRIYRNAIKGGAVQRNMIKSGYKPE